MRDDEIKKLYEDTPPWTEEELRKDAPKFAFNHAFGYIQILYRKIIEKNMRENNHHNVVLIMENIRFIKSNPLSTPLSELITVHEILKMNEELLLKYPSLEDALRLVSSVIERELE